MSQSRTVQRLLVSTAMCVGFNAVGHAASAQQAPPSVESKSGPQLEEVVVTAERRSTDVQRTPVAITAVAGEALERAGVINPVGLQNMVPGLSLTGGNSFPNVSVRGVGGGTVNSYGDPAVAFNVDGIYIGRAFGPNASFYDLDRVEVLKGPQGTLYGRNATVGAINVISKRPTFKFEGEANLQVGNYDDREFGGAVNLPLSDKVASRLAFKRVTHDGYLTNGYDDADNVAARGQLLIEPSAELSILLGIDYFHDGSKGPGNIALYAGGVNQRYLDPGNPWYGLPAPPAGPAHAVTFTNAVVPVFGDDGYVDNDQTTLRAEVNWDLGFAKLTVLPAFVKTKANFRNYLTGFSSDIRSDTDQYSTEARLASQNEGKLKWLLGAFYFDEKQETLNSFLQAPGYFQFVVPHQLDKSYAVFGQATYSLSDAVRVTGGLRYTWENKSQDGFTDFPGLPTCPSPGFRTPDGRCRFGNTGDLTFEKVNWKLGVEWDVGERSLLFANVSTGFKAGGFFMGLAPNTYRPEKITAFQAGSKNRFLDNRLQINADVFYWDYKDQQIPTFANIQPAGFAVRPVNADGWLAGTEINLTYLVADNDRVGLDVLYERGRFARYDVPAVTITLPNGFALPIVAPKTYRDYPRTNLPEWSVSLNYQHKWKLENGGIVALDASTHFETAAWYNIDHIPGTRRDAYMMSSGSLTYTTPGDRWTLAAYIDNIENKDVITYGGFGVSNGVVYRPPANPNAIFTGIRPPRTFGLRLRAKL